MSGSESQRGACIVVTGMLLFLYYAYGRGFVESTAPVRKQTDKCVNYRVNDELALKPLAVGLTELLEHH